jgi:hypothetical protein
MSKPTLATKFITGTSTNISNAGDNPIDDSTFGVQ